VLLDLLRHESETSAIPVHVISGGERADDAMALGASGVIVKPASRDELIALFKEIRSAKPRKRPPAPTKRAPRGKPQTELANRRVLIIDDDIRNIYSLTSVLEAQGAEVLHAERGAEGIGILENNPDVDVALVDIMMPEMDGYETMRRIRSNPAISAIPLVAVTAKAMKGDRQKCLDAGASDYIAKPVDIDMLLALLRVQIERAATSRDAEPAARQSAVA
jgi:CheY-like chemotaxis protein